MTGDAISFVSATVRTIPEVTINFVIRTTSLEHHQWSHHLGWRHRSTIRVYWFAFGSLPVSAFMAYRLWDTSWTTRITSSISDKLKPTEDQTELCTFYRSRVKSSISCPGVFQEVRRGQPHLQWWMASWFVLLPCCNFSAISTFALPSTSVKAGDQYRFYFEFAATLVIDNFWGQKSSPPGVCCPHKLTIHPVPSQFKDRYVFSTKVEY